MRAALPREGSVRRRVERRSGAGQADAPARSRRVDADGLGGAIAKIGCARGLPLTPIGTTEHPQKIAAAARHRDDDRRTVDDLHLALREQPVHPEVVGHHVRERAESAPAGLPRARTRRHPRASPGRPEPGIGRGSSCARRGGPVDLVSDRRSGGERPGSQALQHDAGRRPRHEHVGVQVQAREHPRRRVSAAQRGGLGRGRQLDDADGVPRGPRQRQRCRPCSRCRPRRRPAHPARNP